MCKKEKFHYAAVQLMDRPDIRAIIMERSKDPMPPEAATDISLYYLEAFSRGMALILELVADEHTKLRGCSIDRN